MTAWLRRPLALAAAAGAATLAVGTEALRCDHAIVGAGPAGVYYAWRLGMDGDLGANESVCLFERLDRIGGRVASMAHAGPLGDLTVEPGAYRFVPKRVCGCLHGRQLCLWTPLTGALIQDALDLPSKQYSGDAESFQSGLFKIVDDAGEDAGFLTFVQRMMDDLFASSNAGRFVFRTFLGHTLQQVSVKSAVAGREPMGLSFGRSEGPLEVEAMESVLLNLPQGPLLRVLSASGLRGLPRQLHVPNAAPYLKLYLHYDDAWWRGGRHGGLNLTAGAFENNAQYAVDLPPGFDPMHVYPGAQAPAPLRGRYEDGHVRCEQGAPTQRCHGYLQAHYSDDAFALMFYRSFGLLQAGQAVVNVTRDSHGSAGGWLLDEVHEALVALHAERLGEEAAAFLRGSGPHRPDHAVLAVWDAGAEGFGAACHFSRLPAGASDIAAVDPLEVPRATLHPLLASLGEDRLAVASEAFGPLQCWAEGALQMAEAALRSRGVARPRWLSEELYSEILFSASNASSGRRFAALSDAGAAALALGDRSMGESGICATNAAYPWSSLWLVLAGLTLFAVFAVPCSCRRQSKLGASGAAVDEELHTSLQAMAAPVAERRCD